MLSHNFIMGILLGASHPEDTSLAQAVKMLVTHISFVKDDYFTRFHRGTNFIGLSQIIGAC